MTSTSATRGLLPAPGACSSRFNVLLPASGDGSSPSRSSLPRSTPRTGSRRKSSWSLRFLITERQAEHPLPDQSLERMHGEERAAMIAEARGKSIDEADRLVRLAQQQSPRVRRHQTAVEIRHNPPSASPSKLHL